MTRRSGGFETYAGMTTKLAAAGIHQSTLLAAVKAAAGASAMIDHKTLAGVSAMANYKTPAGMTTKLAAAGIHQSTLLAAVKAAAGASAMVDYLNLAGMASKIAEVGIFQSTLLATVRESTLPQDDPSSQQVWTPSLWCPEIAAAVVSIFVFALLTILWLHEANRLGDTPATANLFEVLGDLSDVVEWSAAAWGATLLVLRGKSD